MDQQETEEIKNLAFYNQTILNDPLKVLEICQSFVKSLQEDEENPQLFNDASFGPRFEGDDGRHSLYFSLSDAPSGFPDSKHIKWYRPSEIVENPVFIKGEVKDIIITSSYLQNNWFMNGLRIFYRSNEKIKGKEFMEEEINDVDYLQQKPIEELEKEQLISGLTCPMFHSFQKYGIYVFRFFKNYKWRYVIIDDQLPCLQKEEDKPKLLFGRAQNENVFWVSLLEKAYAKIHHCYEALANGTIQDAVLDLTGLSVFKLRMKEENKFPPKRFGNARGFWEHLISLRMGPNNILSCVSDDLPIDSGLQEFIAYSIVALYEIQDDKDESLVHKLVLKASNVYRYVKYWLIKLNFNNKQVYPHVLKSIRNVPSFFSLKSYLKIVQ